MFFTTSTCSSPLVHVLTHVLLQVNSILLDQVSKNYATVTTTDKEKKEKYHFTRCQTELKLKQATAFNIEKCQ